MSQLRISSSENSERKLNASEAVERAMLVLLEPLAEEVEAAVTPPNLSERSGSKRRPSPKWRERRPSSRESFRSSKPSKQRRRLRKLSLRRSPSLETSTRIQV